MTIKKYENCKRIFKRLFNKETLKNRIPITIWLPSYSVSMWVQDCAAGAAVGASAVAQGLAYAALAGLPAQHGLYSGIAGGFVYALLGSCPTMSIGPTSIISALTAKYVQGLSIDFAVLAAFLTGLVQVALGVFQLGFLVDFISGPVLTGFVSGAALQIMTSQLKSLLGTNGGGGHSFVESIRNFFMNITSVRPTDAVLGVSTILVLIVMKRLAVGCSRQDKLMKRLRWYVSLARNVIVVVVGIIIAYVCHVTLGHDETFKLIGEINAGLPTVQLPPVTTTVGNVTYSFGDMLTTLGPQSLVIPLVAILEVVVIAKAFTRDARFDSTQEIIVLGLCNMMGSLVGSMPLI
ncbi:sodium-independent sulfate anion transporter [Plutella xylostella]|uniref:sodium-independent sulfate anion transporter n=1 Tax=Plutella xylostella TaxID=51655 RepID=UPI0020321AE5|nr:sodium-independent sulfate anion transporter [Plutella xylostella]